MSIKCYQLLMIISFALLRSVAADVSVLNNVTKAVASPGETNTFFVSLSAPAGDAVTSVTVSIPLPNGLTFVSSSGDGVYTSATGEWTVGGAPLTSAELVIEFTHDINFLPQVVETTATITSITPGAVTGVGLSSVASILIGNAIIDWSQITINGGPGIVFDDTTYTEDISPQGFDITVIGEDIGAGTSRLDVASQALVGSFLRINVDSKTVANAIDPYGNILTLFPSPRSEVRIFFNTDAYPNGVSRVAFTIYDYDIQPVSPGVSFQESTILFGIDSYGNEIYPQAVLTSDTTVRELSQAPPVHQATAENTATSNPAARVTFIFGEEPISGVVLRFWNEFPPTGTSNRALRFSNFIVPGDNFIKPNSQLYYHVLAPTSEACLNV